jgi:hypothetical protein
MEKLGISPEYFKVQKKGGVSQFQMMLAYLGGSAFQTIVDNPVTSYRQLLQQYAKSAEGKMVDPKIAKAEAIAVFKKSPISASLSGLGPRLVGVGLKRVPKFGFLLGISYATGEGGEPGMIAAIGASIFSSFFINPVRMIEKQQRTTLNKTGKPKPVMEILREASSKRFLPLFRGTVPLMGHSLASATTGLVGQPRLEAYIKKELGTKTTLGAFATNLIASTIVSPIYVMMTNPLSRLEVITQTSAIKGKSISIVDACKELATDSKQFGMRGMFRGQGVGIFKAIISLTLFHQGRIFCTDGFRAYNEYNGTIPKE